MILAFLSFETMKFSYFVERRATPKLRRDARFFVIVTLIGLHPLPLAALLTFVLP